MSENVDPSGNTERSRTIFDQPKQVDIILREAARSLRVLIRLNVDFGGPTDPVRLAQDSVLGFAERRIDYLIDECAKWQEAQRHE